MLKNIFKRQINSITVAAFLVALSSLASRLLGVLRDRILAGQFGAGPTLDVYYAAFRIPDMIFNIVVLGALSAGFIPIFTSVIKDFKSETGTSDDPVKVNSAAWELASNVLSFLFLGVSGLALLGFIFAGPLMRLITPGFNPAEQAATVNLTRIMFLSPIFLGLSGILGGVLQSFKRFLIYSLAPIFYNLGIIVGVLYLVPIWGVTGLAWGVVLGAFLHMMIQWPTVFHLGFRYHFRLNWRDRYTRTIGKMMVPQTLGLGITQINLVVVTILASNLSGGSLAIFNFANNLQSFPVGLFGISFAIAAFPILAEHANDHARLTADFAQTFRKILFFVIPATVLIIALRAQIIRVILGTGKFNWEDTILTMNTLGFFALSLFAQATQPLMIRTFYVKKDAATPFYIGLIAVIINTILAWYLAPRLGVTGLALAFSVDSILEFILLWIWLSLKIGHLDIANIIKSTLKLTISAIAAGGAAQITKALVWPYIDMTKSVGVASQLFIAALVGGLVYLGFCYLLGSEELADFLSSLTHRWPFKKVKVGDQGPAQGL